jgi:hypothetical protein
MCQFFGNFQILSMLKIFILIPIQWGWFFFQLFNWFQLFSSKNCLTKYAGHGQNRSKMTILKGVVDGFSLKIVYWNLLDTVRTSQKWSFWKGYTERWFQLFFFFIDFSYFIFFIDFSYFIFFIDFSYFIF